MTKEQIEARLQARLKRLELKIKKIMIVKKPPKCPSDFRVLRHQLKLLIRKHRVSDGAWIKTPHEILEIMAVKLGCPISNKGKLFYIDRGNDLSTVRLYGNRIKAITKYELDLELKRI